MVECEYCEEEFETEQELHIHWGEEHEDDITSHEKEKVKKAEREKDKQKQRKKAKRKEYRNYALMGVLLVGLVAGGAFLAPKLGFLSNPAGSNLGPAGSAHTHADFMVYVNGEPVDFSQAKYQVVSQKAHVEGGNGNVVHGHATGATFGYFMESVGFEYNATYLKTPDEEYYENGKQVRMFVNTAGDWREIEPKAFQFETGDRILLTYGNYTEEEIGEFQSSVTQQSEGMS
jgi:hypothetical protein